MPRLGRAGLLCGLFWLGGALLPGCAGPGEETVQTALSQGQPGYQLAIQGIGCWFGSVWADAEGFPAPQRKSVTDARCREVLSQVYGDPHLRFKAMRAMEPQVVSDVAKKSAGEMGTDGSYLAKLVEVVAAAQREAMYARQAAHSIKVDLRRDLSAEIEKTELGRDEMAAVEPLRRHQALDQLLAIDVGPLTADAHALGLLVASDRIQTAGGLPKHLKVYALEGPGLAVFGVAPPPVPADPRQPLVPGVWLSHLSQLAQAAGYPVPPSVKRPVDQALLARNGVLKGFADRLRQDQPKLSKYAEATLAPIVASVAARLDEDYAEATKVAH